MEWIFEGIGTLVVGIVLGVAGDRAVLRIRSNNRTKQVQKAGDNSQQTQVGGSADVRRELDG